MTNQRLQLTRTRTCVQRALSGRAGAFTMRKEREESKRREEEESEMGSNKKTADLDAPLHAIGFEIQEVSAHRLTGRFKVTDQCCQPFKVLHGGISALVAEALGSIGAHIASGFKRVAGVQLSINHLSTAELGDDVEAEAEPVKVGKRIQLWEVKLWKIDQSAAGKRVLVASSRVTLLCNLPVPEHAREAQEKLKMHAKL